MLEQLTELRRQLLTLTGLLEDVIRDAGEQPDEEVCRARSGRVLSAGASVPVEFGSCRSVACRCVHPESSSNTVFRVFMKVPLLRHRDLISKLLSPLVGQ